MHPIPNLTYNIRIPPIKKEQKNNNACGTQSHRRGFQRFPCSIERISAHSHVLLHRGSVLNVRPTRFTFILSVLCDFGRSPFILFRNSIILLPCRQQICGHHPPRHYWAARRNREDILRLTSYRQSQSSRILQFLNTRASTTHCRIYAAVTPYVAELKHIKNHTELENAKLKPNGRACIWLVSENQFPNPAFNASGPAIPRAVYILL